MARRRTPADPELAALARERLARLLGDAVDAVGAVGAPRRAEVVAQPPDDPLDAPPRSAVGRDDLEAPRRFTRWHLGVVAVVLLVGLVWGGWSWARSRPEAVAAVPTVQTAAGPPGAGAVTTAPGPTGPTGSSAGATPAPAATPEGLVVHVLGAVTHPGLVRLSAGARVQDAIRAAGGLRRDADPAELNLAQPLQDGVQVVVGTRAHPEGEVRTSGAGSAGAGSAGAGSAGAGSAGAGSSGGAGGGGPAASTGSVDLNAAGAEQLETLPGVGPVTSQKILDWRQQHGRFTSVAELQEVDGIGPKTYARIAARARV